MLHENGRFCPRFSAFWAIWLTKPVKGRKSEPIAGTRGPWLAPFAGMLAYRRDRSILIIAALTIGVGLGSGAPRPGYEPFKCTEDVIYGRKSGMALTMDVFQPARPNRCGIVFLVNGGWLSSKDTPLMVTINPEYYLPYLDHGYTVFAVVTSSQPVFTIPEIQVDVHRAVRFVRHQAGRFGIRADCLGVLGSSSGGQLALMISAQGGPGKPDAPDPVDRESSAVQAAACFFPPTDFLNYGGSGVDGVALGPMAPLKAAFGPRSDTPEGRLILGKEISPVYFVTAQLPPTLIIHGDRDDVVPIQQATLFVERARSLGAKPVRLIIRHGKGHGWGEFWKSKEDIDEFIKWFDTHFNR